MRTDPWLPTDSATAGTRTVGRAQWEEHWISIAIDPARSVLGVDSDEVYSTIAELDARIDCKGRGGVQCRTWQTFKNASCRRDGWPRLSAVINTDLEQAKQDAIRACKKDGDTACQVLYADCSHPTPANQFHY
jgi:hypothetical protein